MTVSGLLHRDVDWRGEVLSEPDHPSGVAEPALSLSQEFRTPATQAVSAQ